MNSQGEKETLPAHARICSTEGCGRYKRSRGLCSKCYQRYRKDPGFEKRKNLSRSEVRDRRRSYKNRRERILRATNPEWAERKRVKARARQKRNPEARRARQKRYRDKKRQVPLRLPLTAEARRAHNSLKRLKKRLIHPNQRPAWTNREEARRWFTERDGLEVDHIIPIKHPEVCGLDCPDNYQYLSRYENTRVKNNKFDGTYDNDTWRRDLQDGVVDWPTLSEVLAAEFPEYPDC